MIIFTMIINGMMYISYELYGWFNQKQNLWAELSEIKRWNKLFHQGSTLAYQESNFRLRLNSIKFIQKQLRARIESS